MKALNQLWRGFTLIEVVIALGIVSFAITVMVALLPVGLNVFRDSMEATARADIMRKLSSEFQMTSFDRVRNMTNMQLYTDSGTVTTNAEFALLGVTYDVVTNTPLDSSGYASTNLKAVKVKFYTRSDRLKTPLTNSYVSIIYIPNSGMSTSSTN